MKKISLTISLLALGMSVSVHAQTQTNYLKNARIQLEKDNEQKILEMLENQRLQEEKARLQRLENTSFSVAPQRSVSSVQPAQQANTGTTSF